MVKYLHQRGLKAGIYTDAGDYDPASCGLGSRGHYQQDADQFADWQIDAIKVDFLCGIGEKLEPGPAFTEFSDAVAKSGRPMMLNLCNPLTDDWGLPHTPGQDAHNTFVYGPTVADSWRTGTDIAWGSPTAGEFPNVLRNMDANAWHPEAQGPGHWNDPDYLIPMRQLTDGSYEMNQEESTTQLVMWAEMASPLIIGSDPRTLPQAMVDTLRNPEILAVDQDPLGIQGVRVATDGTGDTYSKVLQGSGRRAVVLLNRSDQPAERTLTFAQAGLTGAVTVRDLRARADRGTYTGTYTVTVPAHGTAMFKLVGTDDAPGVKLGGPASAADPALVRDGDTLTAFTQDADGSLRATTGRDGRWSGSGADLGGPTGGRFLGQPAAYASAGRIDVFVRGTDDHAYLRTYAQGSWGRWQDLGGRIADAPTAAYQAPAPGRCSPPVPTARSPVEVPPPAGPRSGLPRRGALRPPVGRHRRLGPDPRRGPRSGRRGVVQGRGRLGRLVRLDLARRHDQRRPDAGGHRRQRATAGPRLGLHAVAADLRRHGGQLGRLVPAERLREQRLRRRDGRHRRAERPGPRRFARRGRRGPAELLVTLPTFRSR